MIKKEIYICRLIHSLEIGYNRPVYVTKDSSKCSGSTEGLESMYFFTDLASGFLGPFRAGVTNNIIRMQGYDNVFPICEGD